MGLLVVRQASKPRVSRLIAPGSESAGRAVAAKIACTDRLASCSPQTLVSLMVSLKEKYPWENVENMETVD